jgi:rhomboid protease GluP
MLDDARIHLHKVLQLDPNFPEANYNLALIYLEQNDFVQAKKYAEKAAELNPNKKEYTNLVHEINQYLQSSGVGK